MSTNTYLKVPYADKDRVKALGARWDGGAKAWYVPAGRDVEAFSSWVVAARAAPVAAPVVASGETAMTLSEYMAAVSAAMTRAAPAPAWVSAELSEFRSKNGFWMLSLVEYDDEQREVSKASAFAWNDSVSQIEAKMSAANVKMEKGIKILVKVRAEMTPRFGFRLLVLDVDPKFTLGDMELKLTQIRTTLREEGVYDLQRTRLSAPKDYTSVAVVAPDGAAGLGDFMREADILQSWGLTIFETYTCVFQGDRAPRAIAAQLAALSKAIASGQKSYDAVVVIRGGGAVTDLAWLNDIDLARAIATFEIPVLTGIGHERDNTSLDEVSHRRFDTPSKVINHIMSVVAGNAQAGMTHMTSVLKDAQRVILQQETSTEAFLNQCRSEADKAAQRAQNNAASLLQSIDQQSQRLLEVSLTTVEAYAREVLGLSPKGTLDRGYALVRDEDGKVLTTCEQASGRKVLTIQMKDGSLSVKPAKAAKGSRVADEQSA